MTTTKVNLANTVEGILPVANGGTGTSSGVAPGGSTTQVQYNNAGAFGGDSGFVYTGGNVGINTTSPGVKLGVVDTSAGASTFPAIIGNRGTTVGTQVNIGLQTYDSGSAGVTNVIGSVTTSASSGAGSADMVFLTTGSGTRTERLRIASNGAFGLSGANYGSSGQVLTSNGSGSAPTWGSVSLPAGTVRQVVSTNFSTLVTVSGSPSSVSGFSATITPASASNRILIITSVAFGFAGDTYPYVLLNRNGTSIFTGTSASGSQINVFLGGFGTAAAGANRIMQPSKTVLDSPGTTSAVTYQIAAGSGAGTGYINRTGDQGNVGYVQFPTSTITLMEIVT
jgi:hypothetical protein